jgi:hypothetical protein
MVEWLAEMVITKFHEDAAKEEGLTSGDMGIQDLQADTETQHGMKVGRSESYWLGPKEDALALNMLFH